MKTLFKSFVLIAAAALTLSACSKSESITIDNSNEVVTLKFNIRNADGESLTKALLGTENGQSFLNWENGDHIGAYLTGSSNSNNRQGEVEVSGDDYTLNVQAPSSMTVAKIYSYFPYSVGAGANKEAAVVTIPELQHMTSEGFDADAMPMAGSPVDVSIDITTANTNYDCGKIDFSNLGSIIKFRVYTSGSTSETLTSVTYKAAGIGGSFSIDLTQVDAAVESTLALTSTDAIDEITTSYATKPPIGSGAENAIDVYMVVAPGTYSGSQVVVTTNEHTYTLDASGEKTFTRSHVKPIKIDISKVTPGDLPADETWVRTPLNNLSSEDVFVIVGTNSVGSYAMSNNNGTGSAPAAIAVTIADDKITSEVANNIKWNVGGNATDGYTFYPNGSTTTWLYCNSGTGNKVRVGTNNTGNVFTLDNSGYLKNSYNNYLGVYNSQDWRCYSSTSTGNIAGQSFAFYVKTASGSSTSTNHKVTWTDPTETGCSIGATVNNSAIDSGDEFATGTVVTITATVGKDYEFGGWTVNGATAADASASSTTFTIGDSDVTISAAFNSTVVSATALPYEETFASGQGDFTIDNVALDGLTYVWSFDNSYKYMKASGYANSTNHVVESWLISPLLAMPSSLSTGESIKLKFSQVISNRFGTVEDEATLMVKEEGGAWSKVTIGYPTFTGTYSSWDNQVIDLSSYVGKNIQFAFKYVGTSSNNGNWEIKDVSLKKYEPKALSSISVSGQKTIFTEGDDFSFGGVVTATYNDDTTADVTSSSTFSGYNMNSTGEQTVTVSYTESGVNKTTDYTITVNSANTETLVYTLDGTETGGTNGYAEESEINQNSITWKVTGNTTMNPWRIGGKGTADRPVYSTTKLDKNISKIEITHGSASNITINSMTVIVSKNSDFSSPVSTLTPSFVENDVVTVNRPGGADWSDCYYKIVYNVTVSGNSNKFFQFIKAEFTGK